MFVLINRNWEYLGKSTDARWPRGTLSSICHAGVTRLERNIGSFVALMRSRPKKGTFFMNFLPADWVLSPYPCPYPRCYPRPYPRSSLFTHVTLFPSARIIDIRRAETPSAQVPWQVFQRRKPSARVPCQVFKRREALHCTICILHDGFSAIFYKKIIDEKLSISSHFLKWPFKIMITL